MRNKEKQKQAKLRYKEKYLDLIYRRNLERKKKMRLWYNAYKKTLCCEFCGEIHPAIIDFHHKDKKKKEINLSTFVTKGWSIKRFLEEVKKCNILCSNCHRKLHYKNKL